VIKEAQQPNLIYLVASLCLLGATIVYHLAIMADDPSSIAAKALGENNERLLASVLGSLSPEKKHHLLIQALVTERELAIIRALLEHGAPAFMPASGPIPLHLAVLEANIAAALLIVDASLPLDLNATDTRGDTALHLACKSAAREEDLVGLLESLITHNANPSLQDRRGRTPLHYASWDGRWQIVRALLDAKADVDVRDSSGYCCQDLLNASSVWHDPLPVRSVNAPPFVALLTTTNGSRHHL